MKKETLLDLIGLALENGKTESLSIPFKIGTAYLIRTVTMAYTGRVTGIVGKFLEMEEAAWIADTGRFADAVEKGTFSEVEPMGDIVVNSDAILDAVEIKYALPLNQK